MSVQQPWAGGPSPQQPSPRPTPPPPRRGGRPVVFIVAALALVGLVAWYVLTRKGAPVAPEVAPPPAKTETAAAQPPPLPPTAESDARVRELAKGLSSDAEFSKWLGTEGLLQRFTAAVSNISDGESPRLVLSFLAPAQGFQVAKAGERSVIDPKSYERYDSVARVIDSIDAHVAARVYQELKPLIDGTYAEIAPPGQTFDRTFSRAIEHLLAVPVPQGDVALAEKGALYAYADPQLEGLSRAQKHLLRMGPKNVQAIQAKLRELQGTLNLPGAGR